MTRYRVSVGHKDGVKPGQLVGALANEGGIEGARIGRIDIRNAFSVVELPSSLPTSILAKMARARVAGQALEIAEKIGNWGLRERAFTLENFRRQRIDDSAEADRDWILDEEEIRTITGTMGRFPGFRRVGWHILESARVFEPVS